MVLMVVMAVLGATQSPEVLEGTGLCCHVSYAVDACVQLFPVVLTHTHTSFLCYGCMRTHVSCAVNGHVRRALAQ